MSSSATSMLRLYKTMMREAQKFADFNYRSYSQRRIRDGFKAAKGASGEEQAELRKKAEDSLQLIRRQVAIGSFYQTGMKLSVESPRIR